MAPTSTNALTEVMNRQTRILPSVSQEGSENPPELEDYDIMEEIASGESCTVFLVNCKRGRLRNRQLALRKSSASRSESSNSSSIHLSLVSSVHCFLVVNLFHAHRHTAALSFARALSGRSPFQLPGAGAFVRRPSSRCFEKLNRGSDIFKDSRRRSPQYQTV
ncbi:hypothetical protein B0H16DRAFT_304488 [Mycena metata]|uniref:Uncharacterized protein n=1 Tax=Mycena metata TaxID=1033252 RepID=A0AAD7KFM3_9AGAR|nr:hypothetical protein B0H16DRAFT_304488 [Mycena metata]